MPFEQSPLLFWSVLSVLGLGLFSAIAARLSEGYLLQLTFQRAFLTLFALVSLSVIVTWNWGQGWSLLSGAILATMSVMATLDFRMGRGVVN